MKIYNLHVFLSQFGTSCCSMSSSNCCFLTCIQVSLEVGKVVWYSYLLKNFSQFVVIHSVKSFSVVNETEVDFFLEFSGFSYDPIDVSNLISDSSEFWQKFWEDSLLNLCIHNEVAQLYWTLCDPMDLASQAPLTLEFFKQEYWSGLPFPSPGDLPKPGIELRSPAL